MADEFYISIEEVAKRLGVESKTISKYVREEKLKAVKNRINGSIVGFREVDIQEFLTGKPAESQKEIHQQSSDIPEVVDARKQTIMVEESMKQAKLQDEQHKAKIAVELRQKGYEAIVAGLADVETKQKEVLDILEVAKKEKELVKTELDAVMKEKQKVSNSLSVVKERERLVNEKWAEIMVREENHKAFIKKYEDWRKDLAELVEYHKAHVQPCVHALQAITKTIYSWADVLNRDTGHDWTRLYNYLGEKAKVLDAYVERADRVMPTIVTKENGDNEESS